VAAAQRRLIWKMGALGLVAALCAWLAMHRLQRPLSRLPGAIGALRRTPTAALQGHRRRAHTVPDLSASPGCRRECRQRLRRCRGRRLAQLVARVDALLYERGISWALAVGLDRHRRMPDAAARPDPTPPQNRQQDG
jgi:hypothetical protein